VQRAGDERRVQLEKAGKKRRGPRRSLAGATDDSWLTRTLEVFAALEGEQPRAKPPPPPMKLRERAPARASGGPGSPPQKKEAKTRTRPIAPLQSGAVGVEGVTDVTDANSKALASEAAPDATSMGKRLPRVVLKLGRAPTAD
jgi:hypothetical protein